MISEELKNLDLTEAVMDVIRRHWGEQKSFDLWMDRVYCDIDAWSVEEILYLLTQSGYDKTDLKEILNTMEE